MSKLVLGTVQFGLDYGINNTRGKIPEEEINAILTESYNAGIRMLDTASAYGNSEEVIAKAQKSISRDFNIISKYPVNADAPPLAWIEKSLTTLSRPALYGYMFHNFEIYRKHPEYTADLEQILKTGKAQKIGYSLYTVEEAQEILDNHLPCSIVQIPYNIFDQRFSTMLPEFKNRNIEVHVRSIFLQGLFFMNPQTLGDFFNSVKDKLTALQDYADSKQLSIADVCLGFVNANPLIDHIVFGVDSVSNAASNIQSYNKISSHTYLQNDLKDLQVHDENILHPGKWRR